MSLCRLKPKNCIGKIWYQAKCFRKHYCILCLWGWITDARGRHFKKVSLCSDDLSVAPGWACGDHRKCRGAQSLWPTGGRNPPHRLLQEWRLRSWVRQTCAGFYFGRWNIQYCPFQWACGGHCVLCALHYSTSIVTPLSPWICRSIFTNAAHTAAASSFLTCFGRTKSSLYFIQPPARVHPIWPTVGALQVKVKVQLFPLPDVKMTHTQEPRKAPTDVREKKQFLNTQMHRLTDSYSSNLRTIIVVSDYWSGRFAKMNKKICFTRSAVLFRTVLWNLN